MFFSWSKKKRTRKALDTGTVSGHRPYVASKEWNSRQWVCAIEKPRQLKQESRSSVENSKRIDAGLCGYTTGQSDIANVTAIYQLPLG